MSWGIRIIAILLSAFMISSCATNRIQVRRGKDLACKTLITRYDFGKNKPIQAIKSNNSKSNRYLYHGARNKTHNEFSSKKITRKDRHHGALILGFAKTKNYQILPYYGINELMFNKQILESSEINLSHNELKKVPDSEKIINEPGDIIISPSQQEILFPAQKENYESGDSYVVLKQEGIDKIVPEESFDDASVSALRSVKSDQSQKAPSQNSGTFILMLAVLAGLIPLAALKAFPNLAANISFWAAMNPWKTRFMFAGIQIGLGTAAFLLGESLAFNGIHFSDLSRDLLVGAFLTSSLLYPVKHAPVSFLRHSYLRQRAFDLALAISGFMLLVNAGNDPGMRVSFTNMVSFKGHDQQKVNMLNDNRRAPRQLLYYQNDRQVQYEQIAPRKKEASKGMKTLYTILAVIGAVALGFFVAAASCSLSCNGMGGLAALVGIGGGALIIVLAILVIKSIWHPRRVKRIKTSKDTNPIPQKSAIQI
jgi:hypothetical protein